jgi:hypothetical protein
MHCQFWKSSREDVTSSEESEYPSEVKPVEPGGQTLRRSPDSAEFRWRERLCKEAFGAGVAYWAGVAVPLTHFTLAKRQQVLVQRSGRAQGRLELGRRVTQAKAPASMDKIAPLPVQATAAWQPPALITEAAPAMSQSVFKSLTC